MDHIDDWMLFAFALDLAERCEELRFDVLEEDDCGETQITAHVTYRGQKNEFWNGGPAGFPVEAQLIFAIDAWADEVDDDFHFTGGDDLDRWPVGVEQ